MEAIGPGKSKDSNIMSAGAAICYINPELQTMLYICQVGGSTHKAIEPLKHWEEGNFAMNVLILSS